MSATEQTTTKLRGACAEVLEEGEDLTVHGAALGNDDVTGGNGFVKKKWPKEELKKAYESLEGRNFMKNHEMHQVESVIGSVLKVDWNEDTGILYEARINGDTDEELRIYKQIQRGQLEVSVTVKHDPIDEAEEDEETGALIMTNLEFVELSVVPVGASPTADVEEGEHPQLSAMSSSELAAQFTELDKHQRRETPREPTFESTETSPEWGEIDDLTDLETWVEQYTDMDDPGDVEWADLPEEVQEDISSRSLHGSPESDTWDDALVLPVVNPYTDNLNANGIQAAMSRAPQTDNIDSEAAQDMLERLEEEYFGDDSEENRLSLIAAASLGVTIDEFETLLPDTDEAEEVYQEWDELTNMTASQLEEWRDHVCSDKASIDPDEVIERNLKLLRTNKSDWTEEHVDDAKRTISFINRMSADENEPDDPADGPDGCPSEWAISLMNWAYIPSMFDGIPDEPDESNELMSDDIEELRQQIEDMSTSLDPERINELEQLDEQMADKDDPVVLERNEHESLKQQAEQADDVKQWFAQQLADEENVPFDEEELLDAYDFETLKSKFEAEVGFDSLGSNSQSGGRAAPRGQNSSNGATTAALQESEEFDSLDEVREEIEQLEDEKSFYEKHGWNGNAQKREDRIQELRKTFLR